MNKLSKWSVALKFARLRGVGGGARQWGGFAPRLPPSQTRGRFVSPSGRHAFRTVAPLVVLILGITVSGAFAQQADVVAACGEQGVELELIQLQITASEDRFRLSAQDNAILTALLGVNLPMSTVGGVGSAVTTDAKAVEVLGTFAAYQE